MSQRTLSLALHAAAGIVLAVVAVELLPEAFADAPAWLVGLDFVAGGIFFVLVDQGIGLLQRRMGRSEGSAGPWGIFWMRSRGHALKERHLPELPDEVEQEGEDDDVHLRQGQERRPSAR